MLLADADKASLRQQLKAVRAALAPPFRRAAADGIAALAGKLPNPLQMSAVRIVSGYLPIGDELDPRPLMTKLSKQGVGLCLPVVQGREQPLLFRAWSAGDRLDTKAWGIQEPRADQPALTPDLMLVPLLAADRSGNRLGYGAGFYDRSIRALRTQDHPLITVGLAFDEQIIDAVPHTDYDVPLDFVLTPSGLVQCQGAA